MADTYMLSGLPPLATNPTWISVTAPVGTSDQIGGSLLTDDDIPETLTLLSGAGGTWLYVNRENPGDFGPTGLPEHLPGTGLTYTAPVPQTTQSATDVTITAGTGVNGGRGANLVAGDGNVDATGGGVASLQGGHAYGTAGSSNARILAHASNVDGTGGIADVHAGVGTVAAAGGNTVVRGGYGDDENTNPGQIVFQGGQAATAGLILVYYDGVVGLPTSDPGVAGALWSSTGTVKVSAG